MGTPDASPRGVLIGAASLLGSELRRTLSDSDFPVRDLIMMGEGESIGQIVEYNGEARLITELDTGTVEQADVLFVAERGATARKAMAAFRNGRGVAVDLVASEGPGQDPVVNMEVNADHLPCTRPARVRSPHAIVQVLSTTLAQIAGESRLTGLQATVLTPASESGEVGVDELYQQTASVLNFTERPEKVFERQLAFNVVPHALMHAEQGWPDLDERLRQEATEVLSLDAGQTGVRAVLVPVFHSTAVMVSARFDPPVDRARRKAVLARKPFRAGPVTPADIKESRSIHVCDLGDEPDGRIGLWIVADNVRCTGALNSVRIARALLTPEGA